MYIRYLLLFLAFLPLGILSAQDGEDEKKKKKEKKYEDVITDEAFSTRGLFDVHQVDGKTYFELPIALLDDEILVVSRISGHVKNLNFGGAGMKSRPQQVIRWQRLGDKILLRSVSYNSVADFEDPVYESVKNNNFEPVVMTFDIAVYGKDSSSIVFDVTPLFTTDVDMIGALSDSQRKNFSIKNLDKNRSLITKVKAFPLNVEVRHILTYNGDKLPDNQLTGALSVEMTQSFILLPADPMEPRLHDPRVGYFSIRQLNYSLDAQKAESRRYITRWRLEPKDMDAWKRGELVEPVKPIVYYIDPATPAKWAPYIKQGVDDWQKAFEKAGFKNAIMGKYAPSKEEDPDWNPEDVRYSVIRYITTDIQNAQGPHVHDPRTGEILESDILWYHNVMNLLRNWFLIQTAAVNPDAQKIKFDDKLMGELIRFVSAHEVGHTLGLPHNMGSSPAYSVDSLRSPGFVQRMGVSPSIMDYARFNYVAQPEDKGAGLMPKIGPYDDWSIIYGYRPIPEAEDAEAERPILNNWIKERADNPIYRYGQQRFNGHDPSAQTEDIGDDAVVASELGIRNLKRIVPNLIQWSSQEAMPFEDLEELYRNVVGQLGRYMGHVASNVGGVYEYRKSADQEGLVFTPVPKVKQAAAVQFVNQQLFQTPSWLMDNEILQRISPSGGSERVLNLQKRVMNQLFNKDRMMRLIEFEATQQGPVYSLMNLFEDTRKGIFPLKVNTVDIYQRNVQRAYVDKMISMLNSEEAEVMDSDVPAVARWNLKAISTQINQRNAPDARTQMHNADLLERIELALEGLDKLKD